MNGIAEATKDCPRDDCSLSEYGASTSTCMGWITSYDKHGNRTDRGDPNIFNSAFKCNVCGTVFRFRTQYGETTIAVEKAA